MMALTKKLWQHYQRLDMEWSEEMDEYFMQIVPGHTEGEIRKAFEEKFGVRLTEGQIGNRKNRLGIKSGTHGGRFKKGQKSWNKGKHPLEYMSSEQYVNVQKTQFKKGNSPNNRLPVGSVRITGEGYRELKIAEPNKWRAFSNIVWELSNGKIPPNHCVWHANKDRLDDRIENLVLVPRNLSSCISNLHIKYSDKESLETALNIARVITETNKKSRTGRTCKKCGRKFDARFGNQRTCDRCLGKE